MLAMQWSTSMQLTGQVPCWFLEYCASVLQMFAKDSSTLRSTVCTFQNCMHENALIENDEPVDWAMTACGPLPTVTDAGIHAAIRNRQWSSSSSFNTICGKASLSGTTKPGHSSTNKQSTTKSQPRKSSAPSASPPVRPTKKIPLLARTCMRPHKQTPNTPLCQSGHQVPRKRSQEPSTSS